MTLALGGNHHDQCWISLSDGLSEETLKKYKKLEQKECGHDAETINAQRVEGQGNAAFKSNKKQKEKVGRFYIKEHAPACIKYKLNVGRGGVIIMWFKTEYEEYCKLGRLYISIFYWRKIGIWQKGFSLLRK